MDNFQRTVGENIGYASMCWIPHPSGVFDSTQAQVAVDAIMAAHKAEIERLTAELAAAKALANTRYKLLKMHHADATELWEALNDLTYECYDLTSTHSPTPGTYNKSFAVQQRLRSAYSRPCQNANIQSAISDKEK